MKYIRTKDGIYDIEKYGGIMTIIKVYDVDESLRPKYENTNEPHQVGDQFISIGGKDYKIIDSNIAATIEELCDEFVIIRRDDNIFALAKYYPDDKTFYVKTADEEVSLSECLRFEYEIKGAIWTDKGLIYVAKMNDKGGLELL